MRYPCVAPRKRIAWCLYGLLTLAVFLGLTFAMPDAAVYAAEEDAPTYYDGTYGGTGTGRNGDITVEVEITEGRIASVTVTTQNETSEYWESAKIVIDRIVDQQSTDVDGISGATRSSDGIKAAVRDALAKAGTSPDAVFSGGEGTASNPYVIATAKQLQKFAETVDKGENYSDKHIVLGNDIDLSGIENWNPIGAEGKSTQNAVKDKLFAGTFDGQGHTISGMKISGEYTQEANIGLFSTLAGTARVRNVQMNTVDIAVNETGSLANVRAGSIAGDTASASPRATVIDGCVANGRVSVSASDGQGFAGGILGRAFTRAVIINCGSSVDTSAVTVGTWNGAYAGGIAGMTGNNTVLANCAAFGNAEATNTSGATDAYAGGIAGMLSSKTYNVFATGDVSITQMADAEKAYAGVIAGQAAGSSTGNFLYFSSDARVKVNGSDVSQAAYGTNEGQIKPESFAAKTNTEINSEAFAELLNVNIGSVRSASDEEELTSLREWMMADGGIALSTVVWVPGQIDAGIFAGGTGTKDDPYTIKTKKQLTDFGASLNSKIDYTGTFIRLDSDIDLSDADWAPIGGSYYRFNGDFDGNDKTITGLSEGSKGEPRQLTGEHAYIGLFGWINEKARIHDLTLDGVAIYANNTNIGTATVTITAKDGSGYTGTITKSFEITKAANPMTVKAKAGKAKAKKTTKLKVTKVLKVSNAQGKVTYKKLSGNKKIKVAKNGKVTVKKGLKKGTYKVKVAVTAAGTDIYASATKKATIKIKVK